MLKFFFFFCETVYQTFTSLDLGFPVSSADRSFPLLYHSRFLVYFSFFISSFYFPLHNSSLKVFPAETLSNPRFLSLLNHLHEGYFHLLFFSVHLCFLFFLSLLFSLSFFIITSRNSRILFLLLLYDRSPNCTDSQQY